MAVSIEAVKELRDKTGISIGQCKQALEAAGGDMAKAMEILRAQGAAIADKKAGRGLGAGAIGSYVHGDGALGAMVELACETDFVAKNPDFKALADDLAMHVAAFAPQDVVELLGQPFVKDASLTVDMVVKGLIQKFGERTEIVKIVRLAVGD